MQRAEMSDISRFSGEVGFLVYVTYKEGISRLECTLSLERGLVRWSCDERFMIGSALGEHHTDFFAD
jgi:hypothetical protein